MAQSKIQLRKIRDFGENISDTFLFIRQEFKPLLTAFLLVAGIFMLIDAVVAGIYQKESFSFLDEFEKGIFSPTETLNMFTPLYFAVIILSVITFAAMLTVVAVYMKHLDEHGSSPTTNDIWTGFSKYFFRTFLFGILQSLLVIIGIVFCIAPGIYFLVVLMPYAFIIVHEDLSVGETFSRCFDIIKENFWLSLGIYFISGLISSVVSGILGLILGIFIGIGSYFSTNEISTTAAIVMSFLNIIQYLFYIIFLVSAGLNYYSLVETKDGTGLERRLENLGNTVKSDNGISEEY